MTENQIDMFGAYASDKDEYHRCLEELIDWAQGHIEHATHSSAWGFDYDATSWIKRNPDLTDMDKEALFVEIQKQKFLINMAYEANEAGL
jgi:hypothetical protein